MAMTPEQKADAYKFFVIAFDAVPGVTYMQQLADAYGAGMTTQQIVNVYTTKTQFTSRYPEFLSSTQFADKLIENVVGTSATDAAKAAAKADVEAALGSGYSRGDVIYQIFENLSSLIGDPVWGGTAQMLADKVAIAEQRTEVELVDSTDLSVLQNYLSAGTATDVYLTLGQDNIIGAKDGITYHAPLAQAPFLGNVSNTLESGDVISAKGDGNKLVVDLVPTSLGAIPIGPAIKATTNNIQVVELTGQFNSTDLGGIHLLPGFAGNLSNIDAQNMHGVKEWWSVDSRNHVQVEDVRALPEDVLIGMRDTDPEVSFRVAFDPAQLGNTFTPSDSSITFTLDNVLTPGDLSGVPVNGVRFKLNGETHTLQWATVAASHAELLASMQAAAAADPGLAGVTFTLNADNTITATDPAGGTFETAGWTFVDDVLPPSGNIIWNQTIGVPVMLDRVVTTDVELDHVGRTSAGGWLDIGSLGDGGVQQFNVVVDRESWLAGMASSEHLGTGNHITGVPVHNYHQHLEIVNIASKGAKGDLTVGWSEHDDSIDGRVWNGLNDVRVVDGSAFEGKLNLGLYLSENGGTNGDTVTRYLDGATAPVEFAYTGSAQDDLFNVEIDSDVADDPDFQLAIDMGAGDDRLVLDVESSFDGVHLNHISVDGGLGENTLVVANDVGISPTNTFESFANFQHYEVEGWNDTVHNFANLAGIETVTIATFGGADTELRNLPASIDTVAITGKNQTNGAGHANANQTFDDISILGAAATEMTVKLQNTARNNGQLYVDHLNVEDLVLPPAATVASAVRTLNIDSGGQRQDTNVIDHVHAEKVNTFNLTGTQDLTIGEIVEASNHAAAAPAARDTLTIDASTLTGKADVGINGDILTNLNAAGADKAVHITGTAGDKDVLRVDGAVVTDNDTTVGGFETIHFSGGTEGVFDNSNVTGVKLYMIEDQANMFELVDVASGALTVRVNNDNGVGTQVNELRIQADGASTSNELTVEYRDFTPASNNADVDFSGRVLFVGDYKTVTLDMGGRSNATWANKQDLSFLDSQGFNAHVGLPAANPGSNSLNADMGWGTAAGAHLEYDATTVYTDTLKIVGGVDQNRAADQVDSLDVGNLETVLKTIDLTGFNGDFKGAWYAPEGVNSTIKVNNYDLEFDVGAVQSEFITTFSFTQDGYNHGVAWQIDNFNGFNEVGVTLSNLSILDLSALGAHTFADINVLDGAAWWGGLNASQQALYTSLYDGAELGAVQAAANTVITSNHDANFTIVLVGQAVADLSNENFVFSA